MILNRYIIIIITLLLRCVYTERRGRARASGRDGRSGGGGGGGGDGRRSVAPLRRVPTD